MKALPKIVVFEDYHYVEGELELIVSGDKLFETNTLEEYSVKDILRANLWVYKKYLHPEIPSGINRNRVFSLPLPQIIPTHVIKDGEEKIFDVKFDEIICDDSYISEDGTLRVQRYNTIKEGSKLYSAFKMKVYALKKQRREEVEWEDKYEIATEVVGKGAIEITPQKEYYDYGEKIIVRAIPYKFSQFNSWGIDFDSYESEEVEHVMTSDLHIEATFEKIPDAVSALSNATKRFFSKRKSDQVASNGDLYERKERRPVSEWNFYDTIGAFWETIGYIIWVVIAGALLYGLFTLFGWWLLLIPLFFGLYWLSGRYSMMGSIFSSLFSWFFSLLGYGIYLLFLFSIISLFLESSPFNGIKQREEYVTIPTLKKTKENKTIDYVHTIDWRDYDGFNYSLTLVANSDYINYEQQVKARTPYLENKYDYETMLSNVSRASEESMLRVYDSLDKLITSKNLIGRKKAEVIVSMVQSLPYYVIIDESCNPMAYNDREIRQMMLTSPCLPNIQHGIQSPSEFLSNLKGDCDTRTLFLFKVLKHYDYDVVILGSEYYKHSIIGIHFAYEYGNGIHYEYLGKKYWVWETTAEDMEIGELPYKYTDMRYWSVNLN